MKRTLVAGFGNVLRGDDGFGVEVIRALSEQILPEGVSLMDVGTGGLRLAQELLSPYDHLIVVDAMTRGEVPGSLYTLWVDDVAPATSVDLHATVPARALAIARTLGPLPSMVHFIGCEPRSVDELTMTLSTEVQQAVGPAVACVRRLIEAAA